MIRYGDMTSALSHPMARVARAISRSTAEASEVIAASGSVPQKTRCKTFNAELVERVKVDATTRDLVPTGVTVPVVNEFPDAMPADQELLIVQMPDDGEWSIAVWYCEE